MPTTTPESNIRLLNVEKAWEYSQGYGVIVGLLDSEIESSLSAMIISSIAKGAKYILSEESEDESTQIFVVDQIHRAINKGSHVFCCTKSFKSLENEGAWEEVIEKAHNNGMVIVAPTGNSNKRHICFPAGLEGIVSIGACDEVGNRWIHNSIYCIGSNYGRKVDCLCPGVTQPTNFIERWRFSRIDATDIACANMCGVIILLKSVKKDLSYHDILDLIEKYSSNSILGWNEQQGWGIFDSYRALASIMPNEVETDRIIKVLNNIMLEIESIKKEL